MNRPFDATGERPIRDAIIMRPIANEFTLAEIKTLRARARHVSPSGFNDLCQIQTFDEVGG